MISVSQLLSIDIKGMLDSAEDWRWIAWRIRQSGNELGDSVVQPIKAGDKWSGDDAVHAADKINGAHLDMNAVAKEAEATGSFLDDIATGTGDGFEALKKHQDSARKLCNEAICHGFHVEDDGTVKFEAIEPSGPLPLAEQQKLNGLRYKAMSIEGKLKKILRTASEIDDDMARSLKVIFGTEDTFRTEDRNRHAGNRSFETSWIETELGGIIAALRRHGWNDAANLLKHYIDNSGEPYTVNVDRMLKDIPQFRNGVSASLAGVRSGPDGSFQTSWNTTAPNLKDGASNSNWYYALNHFEYRLVGNKYNGQINYNVEVRKRYNWGIPSEHRRDLDKGPIHFEQADLARLNLVGEATDFDVTGKTGAKTTR